MAACNKYCIYLLLIPFILLTACRGERGLTGPEGPQGPAGPSILPTSIEFFADLTIDNDFEVFESIPDEVEVLLSDVMLAYVLEDYLEEDDLEVWRQLPVTDFTANGTRLINFDFTEIDIRIYLDADYELGEIDEFFDLMFRAVHIPSDFLQKVSTSDLEATSSPYELEQLLDVKIEQFNRLE